MDLTPERTIISDTPNLSHHHYDWAARKKTYQAPPECCRAIATQLIHAAYQAGREDAAREVNIDKIRRAARRVCARIVASAHLLDVPFTDAPDQSPWTKAKRDMAALYEAVGIGSFTADWCSCPDCDVTAFNEKPAPRTVKGLDPACPVHGSGTTEGEG